MRNISYPNNQNIYNISLSLALILVLFFSSCFTSCSSTSSSHPQGEEYQDFSDTNLNLENKKRWEDGNIPKALSDGLFQDIHFEYNSSLLSLQAQDLIRQNSQVLVEDPSLHVEIEGHCDKRGTSEYNLALGEERARSVANLMISHGVNPGQIKTVSYGEEIPLDSRETEEAYSKNRRAHFALYRLK